MKLRKPKCCIHYRSLESLEKIFIAFCHKKNWKVSSYLFIMDSRTSKPHYSTYRLSKIKYFILKRIIGSLGEFVRKYVTSFQVGVENNLRWILGKLKKKSYYKAIIFAFLYFPFIIWYEFINCKKCVWLLIRTQIKTSRHVC